MISKVGSVAQWEELKKSEIFEFEFSFATHYVLDFWKVTEPFYAFSFLLCVIFNYYILTISELLQMHLILNTSMVGAVPPTTTLDFLS